MVAPEQDLIRPKQPLQVATELLARSISCYDHDTGPYLKAASVIVRFREATPGKKNISETMLAILLELFFF